MKNKTVVILSAIIVLVLLIVIISNLSKSNTNRKVKIGFIVPTLSNPFFVDMTNSAKKIADSLGNIELIIQAPSTAEDINGQNNMVENMITLKVAAICIVPTSSDGIIPFVLKANKANIPVINIDNKIDSIATQKAGAKIATYIGSDNYDGGKLAGKYIAEKINYSGDVAILEGVSGNDAANKRKAGFLDGIKEYKNIKVVASQVANWNRDQAYTKFQNILLANKNLKAVFACNDEMALGAYSAIVQQKISKENIVLVGFDAIPEAVEAVNAKKMDATIAQQPSLMGAKALIYARDIINDKKVDKMFPSELKLILKR